MNDFYDAVRRAAPAVARYAHGGDTHIQGRVIAYTDEPQVLIERSDGSRDWWVASLVTLDPEPPAQASQDRPRRDGTPSAGGADGQDAPDAPTGHTRDQAHQAAHHAQTQGGQAGIASGLAAIAYAILARTENP